MNGANGSGNGHARHSRFKLYRIDEIQLNRKRRNLIKGLIPKEGLTVVWGPPKCGKSFLVTDMAFHVALGWEYRGRRVQQGSVVYVACEGQAGLDARIEAFRQHRMGEEEDVPPFYLLPTRLDLIADTDQLMIEIASQLPAGLCSMIVIDTLNRSLNGSENKDEDMSAYIAACDRLKEHFHCAIVVIHHCGIDGTRPRGHTSLMGALDCQLAVKKDDAGSVLATVDFMKDGEEGAQLLSRLTRVLVGDDEDGEEISSCIVDEIEGEPQFAEHTKAKPRTTADAKVLNHSLQRIISQHGQPAPGIKQIPIDATVVTLDLWRRDFYLELGSDISPDAKRQDFYRTRKQLQAAGMIGIYGDYVWITA